MLASVARMALAVLAVAAGLAVGVWSIGFAWTIDGTSRAATSIAASLLWLAAGASLLGAGVIGTWRRPRLPGAPLLVLAAMGWFIGEWSSPAAPSAVVFTTGLLAGAAWPALIAHASVRLGRTKIDAPVGVLLVAGYVICVGLLGVIPTIAYLPSAAGCTDCPDNLLGWLASPGLTVASTRLGFALQAVWVAALAVMLGRRLGGRPGWAHRVRLAVQLPAIVSLVAAAADGLHSVSRGSLSNDRLDVALWAVSAAGLIGCAMGAMLPLFRARAARRSVVRIALDVAAAPPLGELQRTLAGVLDDPGLTIAYPIDTRRAIDATGRDASIGVPSPGRAVTTIRRDGVEIALIDHRADVGGEGGPLDEAAAPARLWLENERLHAIQLARMSELRQSRSDIVDAAEAERRRIERDLHDGSQQRLVGLAFELRLARAAASAAGDRSATDRLALAEVTVREALAELRELARGIYPRALTDQGLGAALEDLADIAEIPVSLTASTTRRFDQRVEAAAYQVAAESVKAGVLTRATIELSGSDVGVLLQIHGRGIGPSDVVRSELEDRVLALDGSLKIGGDDERRWIRVELPCES